MSGSSDVSLSGSQINLRDRLQQKAHAIGFHKMGIASVIDRESAQTQTASHSPTALQQWLANGYQADMAWMSDRRRQDIRLVMPNVQSVICVALNYYTPHERPGGTAYAKISRYGWGRDYHKVMHKKLKALTLWLESQTDGIDAYLSESFNASIDIRKDEPDRESDGEPLPASQPDRSHPRVQARYYADTGPIQDKVWAEQAGIGWIAKNGNLITREYGSWVFLGEILTNLKFPSDRPHTQHCGTCTRCIQACPTQAITAPFVVDANRCIAYHTIENRSPHLPDDIAPHLQGWIAGCDICQDVCPWNQRFAQATDEPDFQPYPWNIAPTLTAIASLTEADWNQRFPASALRRIKPEMMRRNAIANLNQQQTHDEH